MGATQQQMEVVNHGIRGLVLGSKTYNLQRRQPYLRKSTVARDGRFAHFISLSWVCDYLSMSGFKLIHVSKRDLLSSKLCGEFSRWNAVYAAVNITELWFQHQSCLHWWVSKLIVLFQIYLFMIWIISFHRLILHMIKYPYMLIYYL